MNEAQAREMSKRLMESADAAIEAALLIESISARMVPQSGPRFAAYMFAAIMTLKEGMPDLDRDNARRMVELYTEVVLGVLEAAGAFGGDTRTP